MKESSKERLERTINWPYCVRREPSGIVILNRNYKPIGMDTRDWVDYLEHVIPVENLELKWEKLKIGNNHSCHKGVSGVDDLIWFYDDGTKPVGAKEKKIYLSKIMNFMLLLHG